MFFYFCTNLIGYIFYSGKIDLTDVKNAAVETFKTTTIYVNDIYEKFILKSK